MKKNLNNKYMFLIAPTLIFCMAFFILPMIHLILIAGNGEKGWAAYFDIFTSARNFESLIATILLSVTVTITALVISTISGVFLERHRFFGRDLLKSILVFPLAFPGVVIGFMVIMLAGQQGAIGMISNLLVGEKVVFAYSIMGLFLGYLYFSIPRVILTIIATAEKMDPALEEVARSLGASQFRIIVDVILPALKPGLIASGAICFATSMGAFGTAFTLATNIDVLAMTIYTEFTLNANIVGAATLSVVLGLITWIVLYISRSLSDNNTAMAG